MQLYRYVIESIRHYNINRFYRKKYSTLNNVKVNDIPMIGMRHLKLKGVNDSKFWNEFISISNERIDNFSPHSYAILSSVIVHLIDYPESRLCIINIFDCIIRRPILLKGLNAELLNMLLVGCYSFKYNVNLDIFYEIVRRCDEELRCYNKNVVEINVEVMHSLARCIKTSPNLLNIIGKSGIFDTFTSFLLDNINKMNPREVAITLYSLASFGITNSNINTLLIQSIRNNIDLFQPLDISTIVFACKDSLVGVMPLLSPRIAPNLMLFTPQQICNLLSSYIKYSSIDSNSVKEVNLLLGRLVEIFPQCKAQEVFNVVNSMIRHKISPSVEFIKSYSSYLLNGDFNRFKMVDLFTLFNSLSEWFQIKFESFDVVVDRACKAIVRYFDKNLAFEKLIYILYYISRVSGHCSAIDSAVELISRSDLSRASVKELCLIKGFMPKYTQLNARINGILVDALRDSSRSFNHMDLACIFQGYNDETLHDLAINRAFKMKNIPLSLLVIILNSGCSSEIVAKIYNLYVKNIMSGNNLNVFDAYKLAILLSDKGYRHLYLERLESISVSVMGDLRDLRDLKLSEYSFKLLVFMAKTRYLSPFLGDLMDKINIKYLSDNEVSQLMYHMAVLELPIDNMPILDALGFYSISWMIYMGRCGLDIDILRLIRGFNRVCEEDRSQYVKAMYMLLASLESVVGIGGIKLEYLILFNEALSIEISRPNKINGYSKYSDIIYQYTKDLSMKKVEREVLACLDYTIDMLICTI